MCLRCAAGRRPLHSAASLRWACAWLCSNLMDYGSHILRQLHLRLQSYHLGGMGCANGCVAINLLRDLLQVGSSART